MKITKEYLRKIIRESLQQETSQDEQSEGLPKFILVGSDEMHGDLEILGKYENYKSALLGLKQTEQDQQGDLDQSDLIIYKMVKVSNVYEN